MTANEWHPTRSQIRTSLQAQDFNRAFNLHGVPCSVNGEGLFSIQGDTAFGGSQPTVLNCGLEDAVEAVAAQIIGGPGDE